ncbi:transposon Tf2-9 polyprotein [Trichonephila inaurata madagascariensis]|uniref:RNA-directed DNA polymerase n=1 Tax=Trichonephila inaurata madagascariensis TaxID=2747483 RepID=A0A8X6JWR0_9ARAC|nr:transposon Tf2-9 polyprotein [Trichonephila inaurata madagascariensis]
MILIYLNFASPVGIGCVLSHVYPDGSERPIAFASRTLSGSEQKYSQIDKEALVISWESFQLDIVFRKKTEYGNADFLSRLPKPPAELQVKDDFTIFQMSQIETLLVTFKELRQETGKYKELGPLFSLREGKNLQGREAQYTIEDGCIMYGQRVWIPKKFQKNVLEEWHAGHLGIVKMKAIGRSFVYWKSIDIDIEVAKN